MKAEEVQAYIAGKNGYPSWRSLLVRANHEVREKAITDFGKEYARIQIEKDRERVKKGAKIELHDGKKRVASRKLWVHFESEYSYSIDQKSIDETPINLD